MWQNKYFINFTAGGIYLPLCFRKVMVMIFVQCIAVDWSFKACYFGKFIEYSHHPIFYL